MNHTVFVIFRSALSMGLMLASVSWAQDYPHSVLDMTVPPTTQSQPPREQPARDDDEPGFVGKSFRVMESSRDFLSSGYLGMAVGLDRYFTDQTFDEEFENESYIKLELKDTMFEAGEHESDIRIKAKLDLPNTEHRLKLVFSSDDRQDETLEERARSISTGERVSKEGSVTALEYSPLSEWRRWKRSARIGIRVRIPLVPFARYRLQRDWDWGEHWVGRIRQSFWYFDDRGWGETTEMGLNRPLTEDLAFKIWGEVEFRDTEDQFDFVQGYTLAHYLSERAVAEYRIGYSGATQPNRRVNSYFLGLNYRRSLYEDWVFLSFIPEIFYPREENWGAEPSVTLELEVYFKE